MQLDKKSLERLLRLNDDQLRGVLGRLLAEYGVDVSRVPLAQMDMTALRAVHYESIHLGASIGICLYPADATSLEDMYGLSDQAMYAVKDAGRNDICFVADLMAHQR